MKHIVSLLICLLLLVACGRPSGNVPLSAELQQAEDLMYPHPDSALYLLQAMTPPADELNHATWALLLTQAKYKCFVDQSDSLVNIAHDYFMKGNNAQRKALALYHKAALLKVKNEADKALPFYLQASEEVNLTEDYRLAYLIYSHIGMIYAYRKLYEYAISFCKQANEYAILSKDPYYIVESYNCLARTYSGQDKKIAVEYYDKAIAVAKANNEFKVLTSAIHEKIVVYIVEKQYENALETSKMLDRFRLSEGGCLTLGRLYYESGLTDSAYYYLNKAIRSDNIYTQRSTYKVLFNLSKKQKDYKRNAEYSIKLWEINDSINKIDRNRALIEMQEKYDQQRVRDELTTQMRLKEQRTWTWVSISLVVLIAVGFYIKRRNQERITRLAEAEERIETLNRMLEEAQEEPSAEAEKDDAFFKRILLQQLGIIRLVATTPTAQNQALLRRLAETGNDEIPAEELVVWKDLYLLIDRLYGGFHTRLTERFGSVLTDKEVQVCCLLCAGFSTKEIAVITRQASSTVYVRKTTARQKMGAPDGADIVEWINRI